MNLRNDFSLKSVGNDTACMLYHFGLELLT